MKKKDICLDYGLSKEEKQKLLDEIKYYFKEEREEDIGIIASENLLNFFLNSMGKHIYNKALDDMKIWFQSKMDNVESDFYSNYKA